jgi:ABC-type transport system involved in cytochrome c biogenesis ATPase subunit
MPGSRYTWPPKLSSVNVSGNKNAPLYVQHLDPVKLQMCTIEELKVLEKVFGRFEEAQNNTERTDLSLVDATPYTDTLQ